MGDDKHMRLAAEAFHVKKAWLLAAAMVGIGRQLTEKDYFIPNYASFENKWLKRHIKDLEDDFEVLAEQILLDWKRSDLPRRIAWFSKKYAAWHDTGFQLFSLGRVHEFEREVGRLGFKRIMDCPPYAELLLQGFSGAAVRHPEYHLSRDLALLFNLFLDSQEILDQALKERRIHSSEHNQSLGRSVILTCFNLLESFTSGLATAYLMENPSAAEGIVTQLQGKKPNGRDMGLRERFALVPGLVSGKPKLDDGQPPLKPLFSECKQRRDSFVHCEPGPKDTKWGYNKEQRFHEVDECVVRETVDLTYEAICVAWKHVCAKDRPTWLTKRLMNGRFAQSEVVLHSAEATDLV